MKYDIRPPPEPAPISSLLIPHCAWLARLGEKRKAVVMEMTIKKEGDRIVGQVKERQEKVLPVMPE